MKIKIIILLLALFYTKEACSQYLYSNNTWFSESYYADSNYELFSQIGNAYQQMITNEYTLISGLFLTNDFSGSLSTTKNLVTEKVSTYPNPVKETLFIKSKEKSYTYKFYDLNGKEINITGNITPNKTEKVLISNLRTGIYIIKLFSSDGSVSYQKIIKL